MVAEGSACGRWMRRDGYEGMFLELTGRVRNVALSVRVIVLDPTGTVGVVVFVIAIAIASDLALCLLLLIPPVSRTFRNIYPANVPPFVLGYIRARFPTLCRSVPSPAPSALHPHNIHGRCPSFLFCPLVELPLRTSPR